MSITSTPAARTITSGPAFAFTSRRDVKEPFHPVDTGTDGPQLQNFAKGTAALILAEGVDRWSGCTLADGFARLRHALRPGGLLRVTANDLDTAVHSYLCDRYSEPGGPSRATRLDAWFRSIGRACNEEDLRTALDGAGFVEIMRFIAGSGSIPAFWDLEPAGADLLVLEARCPLGGA